MHELFCSFFVILLFGRDGDVETAVTPTLFCFRYIVPFNMYRFLFPRKAVG